MSWYFSLLWSLLYQCPILQLGKMSSIGHYPDEGASELEIIASFLGFSSDGLLT